MFIISYVLFFHHFSLTFLYSVVFAYKYHFHYCYITILPTYEFKEHSRHDANISNQKKEGRYRVCYFIYWIILHYFLIFILYPTVVCFDYINIHSNFILLDYFIHRLKFSENTGHLSRYNVLAISPWWIQFICILWWVKQVYNMC